MFSTQPSFEIPFLNFVHRFSPEQRQRAKNFRGKFQAYGHPQNILSKILYSFQDKCQAFTLI